MNMRLNRCDQPIRILVLGDSFAYGHGVRHQFAWPAQLETKLQQSGLPALVLNAAVPASTTDQQFLRLKRLIHSQNPDIVIWMVNYNDMSESNYACLTKLVGDTLITYPAIFNIAYINALITKYLPDWLIETRLGNLLTTTTIAGMDFFTFGCSFADGDKTDLNEQTVYFKKLPVIFNQAQTLVDQNEVDLLFVLGPLQAYFDPAIENSHYMLQFFNQYREALRISGVEWLDMTPQLAALVDRNILWNREGSTKLVTDQQQSISTTWTRSPHLTYFLDQDAEGRKYDAAFHPNQQANVLMSQILYQTLQTGYAQQ